MIEGLGLLRAGSADLADTSPSALDWIAAEGITQLAVHLDVDVLAPAAFLAQLMIRPGMGADYLAGVPRRRMTLEEVVRLLADVGPAGEIMGLAVTEYLPGRPSRSGGCSLGCRC